jgi:hypothetical protein
MGRCWLAGRWLAGRWLPFVVLLAGGSIGCLAVWLPAGLFLLAAEVAGELGGPGDRAGCGHAEFSRVALDETPEPVSAALSAVGAFGQAVTELS